MFLYILCSILVLDKLLSYLAYTLESCNFSFTSVVAVVMTYWKCVKVARLDTILFSMHSYILT